MSGECLSRQERAAQAALGGDEVEAYSAAREADAVLRAAGLRGGDDG